MMHGSCILGLMTDIASDMNKDIYVCPVCQLDGSVVLRFHASITVGATKSCLSQPKTCRKLDIVHWSLSRDTTFLRSFCAQNATDRDAELLGRLRASS